MPINKKLPTSILPELQGWLENGESFSQSTEYLLYEHFFYDMDYGTQTGDTGTFDEWIADRPEYIEDLIAELEMRASA